MQAGAFDSKWTPFQWSGFPPAQLFTEKTEIDGLRLSTVYGKNTAVRGVDVGVVSGSEKVNGLQISLVNLNNDTANGCQTGVLNFSEMNLNGAQVGLCNSIGRDDRMKIGNGMGAQLGWVNVSNSDFTGVQLGATNLSDNAISGSQIGLINCCDDIGNAPKRNCFQFGILNFNKNGFLPFFVLVNF